VKLISKSAYVRLTQDQKRGGPTWNPPISLWSVEVAPPMRTIGQQLAHALPKPASACTTPGPDTAKHTAGRPVM